MAVDSTGSRLYVPNHYGDSISVIDTADNMAITQIAVISPGHLAVSHDDTRLYVGHRTFNRVSVLDIATRKELVTATLPGVYGANGIALSPDEHRLYVSQMDGADGDELSFVGMLSAIETSTSSILATLRVGRSDGHVAVTPNGAEVYIVNCGSKDVPQRTVWVVDARRLIALADMNVGIFPTSLAVAPDGLQVYVTSTSGVSVIDANSHRVANTIWGPYYGGIAIHPDGSRLYVGGGYDGRIHAIDLTNHRVVATTRVDGGGVFDIIVNPDGTRLYAVEWTEWTVQHVVVIDITPQGLEHWGRPTAPPWWKRLRHW